MSAAVRGVGGGWPAGDGALFRAPGVMPRSADAQFENWPRWSLLIDHRVQLRIIGSRFSPEARHLHVRSVHEHLEPTWGQPKRV